MLLACELDKFLYNYVKSMVKGFNPETGSFDLQLRNYLKALVDVQYIG